MSAPTRYGRISASVALAAAVLAASNADLRAQEGMSAEARGWQRQSMQALRFERAVEEQRRQLERAEAHARMPSTMYASTPVPQNVSKTISEVAFPLRALESVAEIAALDALAEQLVRRSASSDEVDAARGREGGF